MPARIAFFEPNEASARSLPTQTTVGRNKKFNEHANQSANKEGEFGRKQSSPIVRRPATKASGKLAAELGISPDPYTYAPPGGLFRIPHTNPGRR